LATWPGQTEGRIIAGNGITAALKRMHEADPAHPPQGIDPGSPWMIPVRPRTFDSQLAAEKYGMVDNWSTEASEDDPLLVAPILQELQAAGDDLTGLFLSEDELGVLLNPPDPTPDPQPEGDQSDKLKESFQILIECRSENEQLRLLENLSNEGINCRALVS
jgi:hypothetical protein